MVICVRNASLSAALARALSAQEGILVGVLPPPSAAAAGRRSVDAGADGEPRRPPTGHSAASAPPPGSLRSRRASQVTNDPSLFASLSVPMTPPGLRAAVFNEAMAAAGEGGEPASRADAAAPLWIPIHNEPPQGAAISRTTAATERGWLGAAAEAACPGTGPCVLVVDCSVILSSLLDAGEARCS